MQANWKTLDTLPDEYGDIISVEREDGKISSLVISLPGKSPLRLSGYEYGKAIVMHGPQPPKSVEIHRVTDGDLVFYFKSESKARAFCGRSAVVIEIESLTVSELDLPSYQFVDAGSVEASTDMPF